MASKSKNRILDPTERPRSIVISNGESSVTPRVIDDDEERIDVVEDLLDDLTVFDGAQEEEEIDENELLLEEDTALVQSQRVDMIDRSSRFYEEPRYCFI
jgi:hypothetical protein